jgi:hypothetical protein
MNQSLTSNVVAVAELCPSLEVDEPSPFLIDAPTRIDQGQVDGRFPVDLVGEQGEPRRIPGQPGLSLRQVCDALQADGDLIVREHLPPRGRLRSIPGVFARGTGEIQLGDVPVSHHGLRKVARRTLDERERQVKMRSNHPSRSLDGVLITRYAKENT